MSFLSEYAARIIAVSVLSAIFEIILPSRHYRKYITMVIGLVIMSIIIEPIGGVFSDFEKFKFETDEIFIEQKNFDTKKLVVDEFEKNLEAEIEQGVSKKFACGCKCEVLFSVNDNGEITSINKVEIFPYSDEIADFISENYGVLRERICEVGKNKH